MTESLKKYFILSFTTIILLSCSNSNHNEVTDNWKQVDEIVKRIIPPTFPDKIFDITKYGAIGDGKTDCTNSFKLAIDECVKNGGGKVIVPAGVYLSGAIHLKSNVNLYFEKDAVIKFSTDPMKYLPLVFTRWEGVECMNYSLIDLCLWARKYCYQW